MMKQSTREAREDGRVSPYPTPSGRIMSIFNTEITSVEVGWASFIRKC